VLNSIINLLDSILKPAGYKKTNKNASQVNKPLRIQTIYRSGASLKKIVPRVTDDLLLNRQKEFLLRETKYASVEEIVLPKNKLVVGLTRHAHLFMGHGVFVYERDIPYTDEWRELKTKAQGYCGIAFFQTNCEIKCLRIMQHSQSGKPAICRYLIDHKAISLAPREWLIRHEVSC